MRWIALYRLYDEDDHLLYVGVTNDFGRRMEEHEATKAWYRLIDHHETVFYPHRSQALDAEEAAIWLEDPIYNIDRPLPDRARPDVRLKDTQPLLASIDAFMESL